MLFDSLRQQHLDQISGCDAKDDFDAQDACYMADLKARNVFRKVIIEVNDRYTEVIELSNIENEPDFFNRRVIWHSDFNGVEKDTVMQVSKKFLEKELKELDMSVRHYGKRVIENLEVI